VSEPDRDGQAEIPYPGGEAVDVLVVRAVDDRGQHVARGGGVVAVRADRLHRGTRLPRQDGECTSAPQRDHLIARELMVPAQEELVQVGELVRCAREDLELLEVEGSLRRREAK
jgi:hypothetical protein